MRGRLQASAPGRQWLELGGPSKPPFGVTSSRFSGTRVTMSGRNAQGDASHLGLWRAISSEAARTVERRQSIP